jgi:hypothetical protein
MPQKATLNFYELPAVKKHMPKVEDRQIEFTGMGLQQHILAVEKTGSGNSQCLLNYIYETSRPSKGTFQKIILCYKTFEPLYKFLDENLNGDDAGRPAAASSAAPNAHKRFQMVEGVENLPPISSFPDSSEKNKRQTLVIFDDVVNDRDTKSLKKCIHTGFSAESEGSLAFSCLNRFSRPTFSSENSPVGFCFAG